MFDDSVMKVLFEYINIFIESILDRFSRERAGVEVRETICEGHIYIQSNLAMPTPGFHVTPLITSAFQSPNFPYLILM